MKLFKWVKSGLVAVTALFLFVPGTAHAQNYGHEAFLQDLDSILQEHVHKSSKKALTYNGVDYDALAADIRYYKLKKYLSSLDALPELKTSADRMAFWINIYNFLTIDLIVKENERESIRNLGSVFQSAWKKHQWMIAGKAYTLDGIEHEILRPMGDARIHFAINCAAVSCPDLRNEAYRPEKLEVQLEEQVRLTLKNEGKGFKQEGNTIYLSKVMDWFKEDFDNGDLKSWLKPYLKGGINDNTRIEFLPYDWSLNKIR